MNYTTETIKACLELVATLKSDKITKGNVEKLRAAYRAQADQEVSIAMSSICSIAERHLDRKAANRPAMSKCAESYLNFDWRTIPGCVGFSREVLEV
ncbi:hypothetical protein OLCHANIL_00127 [Vibrio phage V05]|uniref:Uncharacterized protein n=3 Tax=Schizotequatrovirus KVP40 TaxID=1914019 RepID=A0A6B9SX55_9CAUD|nr:hypothetical protein pp2_198 [Vibrio phage phi-pp2]QHJ74384.1 hypothetical protein VH12019_00057 [Vibrio phage VH1_2019]QIW90224.1 hypothetical protein OLCHANIL_00127 [Vibrio phage V05]QIW91212.1 hypothetical protein COHAPHLL_00376 [Vibrio phage V09]UNA01717.1 hypothetical protein [Vibrio phage PC-Liy1]URQ03013.1 hypothetical protein PVA8_27 [Vibrio phage PVA8]WBM58749.1 hypothetical protein vBValMPVA8_27 [Vibrio phage vB_ValM_PVA8]